MASLPGYSLCRGSLGSLPLLTVALCASARADVPARAATAERVVIFPAASPDHDSDLRTALNPVVFAALQDLQSVQIAARAALDLPAMEMAVDCVGEMHACLSAVMQQYTDAEVLIAPSVQRAGDEP